MKKLLPLIGMCILLSSFAFAAIPQDGLMFHWNFSNGANDASSNNNDGTISGATNTTGYEGSGYSFDGTNDYVQLSNFEIATNSYTFCAWLNSSTGFVDSDYQVAYRWEDSGGGAVGQSYISGYPSGIRHSVYMDGSTYHTYYSNKSNLIQFEWAYWCHVVDSSTSTSFLYKNAVQVSNGSIGSTLTNKQNNVDFFLGNKESPIEGFDGIIDEVSLWNRTLSQVEIGQIIGDVLGAPSFIDPTPSDNARNNTYSNVVFNTTTDAGSITFWWNGTIVGNGSESSPFSFELNSSLVPGDGTYSYWASGDGGVTNTTKRNWTYDTVSPGHVINPNNFFNIDNESTVNQYDDLIDVNLTLTDDSDLFAFELNITLSGVTYFNKTDETLGGTSYTYFETINTSGWPDGRYDVSLLASDSHTAKEIKNYAITTERKKLKYNTDEGNSIEIYSEDDSITSTTKKGDRYEFQFDFTNKGKATRVFHVKSDKPIVYKPNTGYKAHFVIWNGDVGNWVDFEGVEGNPIIRRLSPYHYTVTFNTAQTRLKFNSIGGLNVNSWAYSWYKGEAKFSHYPSIGQINSSINITLTKDSSILDISATSLVYNGTTYTDITKTSNANNITFTVVAYAPFVTTSVGIPYTWNLNTIQQNGNISYSINSTHTVSPFGLDNCSNLFSGVGNATALNFSLFDEDNLTSISAQVDGTITYTYLGTTNDFLFSYPYVSNFQICIYPQDSEMVIDAFLKHDQILGFNERYYLDDEIINNETQQVYMYNFLRTDGVSELIAFVKNNIYNPMENIIVKLQRYYPAENVWRTVQVDKTDEFGKAIFYVIQNEEDYRFIFESGQTELDRTESVKFACGSSTECEQTFVIYDTSSSNKFTGMTGSINYYPTTDLYILTWTDPGTTASSVRFLVEKQASDKVVTICNERLTSSSGSIVCNVSGYTGLISARAFRAASPDSAWISESYEKLSGALSSVVNNGGGMALSGLIIVGLIGFGASTGSAIVVVFAGVLGLILLTLLKLTTMISLTMVVSGIAISVIVAFMVKR